MSLYILDTDHVSLFQKNHAGLISRIGAVEPTAIAVSIITVEEQLRGWFKEIRRASGPKPGLFSSGAARPDRFSL